MIKLVLVDDVQATRKGLRMCLTLEPDMTIVGEAGDVSEALSVIQAEGPDVVLMDIGLPEIDGIEGTKLLRKLSPKCHVVILSIYDDAKTIARAKAAGANGFVSKNAEPMGLITTIRQAATTLH